MRSCRSRPGQVGALVAAAGLATALVVAVPASPAAAAVSPGGTQFVSVDSNEEQGGAPSSQPAISADGRYVAFATEASLDPFDKERGEPGESDVYVRDLTTGTTVLLSHGTVGDGREQADGPSRGPSISSDGRYIAFETSASNLGIEGSTELARPKIVIMDRDPDGDGQFDEAGCARLYCHEFTRVNPEPDSRVLPGQPSLAADGNSIAWTAFRDGGELWRSSLARGPAGEIADVTSERVRVFSDDVDIQETSDPHLSGNGGRLVFAARYDDTPEDDRDFDTFAVLGVDLAAGPVEQSDGPAEYPTSRLDRDEAGEPIGIQARDDADIAISGDGRFVAFETSTDFGVVPVAPPMVRLVPFATDGVPRSEIVSRDTDGAPAAATDPSLSSDGRYVAFSTPARMMHNGIDGPETRCNPSFAGSGGADRVYPSVPEGGQPEDSIDRGGGNAPANPPEGGNGPDDTLDYGGFVGPPPFRAPASARSGILRIELVPALSQVPNDPDDVFIPPPDGSGTSDGVGPGTGIGGGGSGTDGVPGTGGGTRDGVGPVPSVCDVVVRDLVLDGERAAAGLPRLPGELASPSLEDVCVDDLPLGETCEGADESLDPVLSGDGGVVAFESAAGDLVVEDNNAERDVFARTFTPRLIADPVDFGPVRTGGTAIQSAVLQHEGFGPLPVTSLAVVGAGAAAFTISGETCAGTVLHTTGTCPVSIEFAPATPGPADAVLEVGYRGFEPPLRVPLTGSGVGEPPVTGEPVFTAAPVPVVFGERPALSTGPVVPLTVTNTGSAPMTITGVRLPADPVPVADPALARHPEDFAVFTDGCGGRTLAPAESCVVALRHNPQAVGPSRAVVEFTDTAAGSPHLIALEGAGAAPRLEFNPAVVLVGRVTTVYGFAFPPLRDIALTLRGFPERLTARTNEAGNFTAPLVIFPNSLPGERIADATVVNQQPPIGVGDVKLLVVPGTVSPPDFLGRR